MSQNDENRVKQIVKKKIKSAIISASTPILIAFIAVIVIAITISSILNYVFFLDGTVNEGDKSNVPFMASRYSTDAIINYDGTIEASVSAQEIWDTIKENDGRLDEYLEKPEELKKLINAEAITDFLDTRPNPDDPIDWDSILEDTDSKEIQGIIKLKRATSEGKLFTMIYTDPDTFQANIDRYNETGSEEDKQIALRYFTIERGYKATNGGNYATGTDGVAKPIEEGEVREIPQVDDPSTPYDESKIGTTYTFIGWQRIGGEGTGQLRLIREAGMTFDEEDFGRINGRYAVAVKPQFGKVGDYIDYYYKDKNGNEKMIPCIMVDVKGSDATNPWGHNEGKNVLEFYVNKDTWEVKGHPNPGENGFHDDWVGKATKIVNGGSYFDNPNFVEESIEINENKNTENNKTSGDNSELMMWPTESTYVSSPFGHRTAPTEGASTNHGGIDIGYVAQGDPVYAAESGKVILARNNGSAGLEVRIDHGNGYVTRYLHNSLIGVKEGDTVQKGQVIAGAGGTGVGTGVHVHFEIQYNGQKIDPLQFEYQTQTGGTVGGEGWRGIGSDVDGSSFDDKYYAKVATWNSQTDTLTSTDPDVEEYVKNYYNMTATSIDYKSLVSGFTMPFEYLWDFLLVGGEKEFVLELADLVYDSEVEITVHDNLTTNTNITTNKYTKKTKVVTHDVTVDVSYSDTEISYAEDDLDKENPIENTTTGSATERGGPFEAEEALPCTTVLTVVNKTNTLDISLTKADVWFVEYIKDYAYQIPDAVVTDSPTTYPKDIPYPGSPEYSNGEDAMGLAEGFRQGVQSSYEASHDSVSTSVTGLTSDYYHATVNRSTDVRNILEKTQYIQGPALVREKTDPNSIEPNFVTIYSNDKHNKNANNIYSAYQWLYQELENNEDTKEMVDLTKYLLYKVTDGTLDEVTSFEDAVDIN